MTGAMLPRGCDAVVPVEQVQRNGAIAEIGRKHVQPWQNVHRRGSDCRQGALLLAAGTRLSAPEVAIAAGAGMARLRVSAQPMIVVISTGNELVEPGEVIEPHQVRRSNAYGITAACASMASRASPTITCATTKRSSPSGSASTCARTTC